MEMNVSGVELGVCLLQTRDRMRFSRYEESDNAAMYPIAHASKSLTRAELRCNDIGRETLVYCMDLKILAVMLHP